MGLAIELRMACGVNRTMLDVRTPVESWIAFQPHLMGAFSQKRGLSGCNRSMCSSSK